MQCFYIDKQEKLKSLAQYRPVEGEAYWIILLKDEMHNIREVLHMTDAMIKNWLDSETVAKVEVYKNYDLGVLQRISWKKMPCQSDVVYFCIGQDLLVTIINEEYDWLKQFVKELSKEDKIQYTLGYVFYRLLDCIIGEDKTYLESLARQTERIEEDILNEVVTHFVKDIIEIRKKIAFLKRHYDPLIDVVEDLMSNENELCSKEDVRYFKILSNRINRLNHFITEIDDYTTHVREAYDAQIDIKLNRIMKYFTMITSLFLPLTLIVGWYGMNFEAMPEISWKYGYIYVIGISVMSSIFCLYVFKKKKWL